MFVCHLNKQWRFEETLMIFTREKYTCLPIYIKHNILNVCARCTIHVRVRRLAETYIRRHT